MEKIIYYLPGHGGRLDGGLGQELLSRGFDVAGRSISGEFKNLAFSEQVDLVAEDIKNHFWSVKTRVIANSFGAYIFLHAQAKLEPYVGKVLLLSPIIGEFGDEQTKMNFVPAKSKYLDELVRSGNFNIPLNCQIFVGSEDWQSNPKSVLDFSRLTGIKATVVHGSGHSIDKVYVKSLLDEWFN